MILTSRPTGWQLTVEEDGLGFAKSPGRIAARIGAHLKDASAARLEAVYVWPDTMPGTRPIIWKEELGVNRGRAAVEEAFHRPSTRPGKGMAEIRSRMHADHPNHSTPHRRQSKLRLLALQPIPRERQMKRAFQTTTMAAGLLALTGCVTAPHAPSTETAPSTGDIISIAVGPCFGFCPVYKTEISPGGTVVFTGERHTAVLGERRREAGAGVYRSLASDLAAFRPVDGTTQRVECDADVTDTSTYTITWRKPDGREAVATHQSRCSGGPGQTLDILLRTLPAKLGVAAWAKQVTRPGAARG